MEGYVHLARMIDKCRAVLAGTEGEYIYPCPMDNRLMEFASITADEFTAAVKADPSDKAMAKWFTQKAQAHPQAELEAWNRMMLNRGPSTPEKQGYFNKLRDAVDPSRTDLTAWSDLQDLEEGRAVPKR
jgi:TorA maturation chaperone TorD